MDRHAMDHRRLTESSNNGTSPVSPNDDPLRRLYIKLRPGNPHADAPVFFHIHVDAKEPLPDWAVDDLLALGMVFDSFDHEYRIYGADGDPTKPFPSYAPLIHLTFMTASSDVYRRRWREIHRIALAAGTPCYLEGELVILDEPLTPRPFDDAAFDRVAPLNNGEYPAALQLPYTSAIDGRTRLRPGFARLRRLDPVRNGRRDRCRAGEVHLSVRGDVHPRTLELLCAMGFSAPAIPKLVESDAGLITTDAAGAPVVIHDLPLTIQAMSLDEVVRMTNLAVSVADAVGGVEEGSIKLERMINFEVLNGLDYAGGVPPVIEAIELRSDFQHLGSDRIGEHAIDVGALTRSAGRRASSSPHVDKRVAFDHIWSQTGDGRRTG
jgi:hypothetical protein